MDADEGLYHAKPQTRGKVAHTTVDEKTGNKRRGDLFSLPIYSARYNLMGKIDVYREKEKLLIERKYQLKQIYQGQIYQLWAQYFCLTEMGYVVERLAFYEISTNRMYPVALPTAKDTEQLAAFIQSFQNFNPCNFVSSNSNKCRHCIYCNLCDKTEEENVYQ